MGLNFDRGLIDLRDNAEQVSGRYEHILDDKLDELAVAGEVRMKERAPWNDDADRHHDRVPGAARAGLHTSVETEEPEKFVDFSHGVDYGIYLETKYHGRDQIIMPTVKAMGEEFMASLEGSLSELDEH